MERLPVSDGERGGAACTAAPPFLFRQGATATPCGEVPKATVAALFDNIAVVLNSWVVPTAALVQAGVNGAMATGGINSYGKGRGVCRNFVQTGKN